MLLWLHESEMAWSCGSSALRRLAGHEWIRHAPCLHPQETRVPVDASEVVKRCETLHRSMNTSPSGKVLVQQGGI